MIDAQVISITVTIVLAIVTGLLSVIVSIVGAVAIYNIRTAISARERVLQHEAACEERNRDVDRRFGELTTSLVSTKGDVKETLNKIEENIIAIHSRLDQFSIPRMSRLTKK